MGEEIGRLLADDEDATSPNNDILYSLASDSYGKFKIDLRTGQTLQVLNYPNHVFIVNQRVYNLQTKVIICHLTFHTCVFIFVFFSGRITVLRGLFFQPRQPTYILRVMATDMGSPPLYTEVSLTIHVNKVHVHTGIPVPVYMLQSIVGTSHYRECRKFSVNTGNACDHQSLPVLPKIFSHYRECLKLRASFSQDCLKIAHIQHPPVLVIYAYGVLYLFRFNCYMYS